MGLLRECFLDHQRQAPAGLLDVVARDLPGEVRVRGPAGGEGFLQGLAGGLSDRAVKAVRQWRFTPAQRLGAAVDVIVEVAVEFKLR